MRARGVHRDRRLSLFAQPAVEMIGRAALLAQRWVLDFVLFFGDRD